MPDEYGNIIQEDLDMVYSGVVDEFEEIYGEISDLYVKVNNLSYRYAKVLEVATGATKGVGAVKIECPEEDITKEDDVWAYPEHVLLGRYAPPNVGSWVRVYMDPALGNSYIYTGGIIHDAHSFLVDLIVEDGEVINEEEIGFVDPLVRGFHYGGRRFGSAIDAGGDELIFESTKDFIFGLNKQTKEVDIRVNDGWKIRFHTGDGGDILIGNNDVNVDTDTQTGGTNVKINCGTTGNCNIETISGNITIVSQSGDVSVECVNATITASSKTTIDSDLDVTGKVHIQNALDVDQDIVWNKATQPTRASTHQHPTAVPGPPSSPTPGS